MKSYRSVVIAAALALGLAGCTTISTWFGSVFGSGTAAQDALVAAETTFTAYNLIFQKPLAYYGSLPQCVSGGPIICMNLSVFNTLANIDTTVTADIVAAQPVLDGVASDSGQIAAATAAITAAETQIVSAGLPPVPATASVSRDESTGNAANRATAWHTRIETLENAPHFIPPSPPCGPASNYPCHTHHH